MAIYENMGTYEKFDVNNYQNLSESANIINTYLELLNADNVDIENAINSLNDSNIFMGPACDELIEGWLKVKNEINAKSTELLEYKKFLNLTEYLYKETDSVNADDITSV